MNYISILLIGVYFISIVERNFIGRFYYESILDTSGIKELVFGNGFAYHLWNTRNQESEYMYVINTRIYLDLPVRHLRSHMYVILIILTRSRNGNHSYNQSRADNYHQNSKIFPSDGKRYVECRLGVGGLANKMFGLVSSFVVASLLNATLICMTVLLRSHFSSI